MNRDQWRERDHKMRVWARSEWARWKRDPSLPTPQQRGWYRALPSARTYARCFWQRRDGSAPDQLVCLADIRTAHVERCRRDDLDPVATARWGYLATFGEASRPVGRLP